MAISDYTSSVILDISCNDPVSVIKAKQLDSMTRKVLISFVDEFGNQLEIPSGASAEFRIQRPDGILVTTENTTITGSSYVNVYLTDSMLEVPGRAIADVRIKQDSQVLSARAFYIDIYQTAEGKDFTGYIGTLARVTIMTRDQYDNTTPSDNVVYYVREDDGTITQYLGDIQIGTESGSGSFAGNFVNLVRGTGLTTTAGTIEEASE